MIKHIMELHFFTGVCNDPNRMLNISTAELMRMLETARRTNG